MGILNILNDEKHEPLVDIKTNLQKAKVVDRGYFLYERELKKGVELGRKLGAFERRYGKLRSYITDLCTELIVKQGFQESEFSVLVLRNTVRIMKGKNKL